VALALQRCFYNLHYSDESVAATELTKSFVWDILDAFMQRNVEGFSRVLQDNLALKMKVVLFVLFHFFMLCACAKLSYP
jgi:ubiquitin carboxyl-terminal hydrolase 7